MNFIEKRQMSEKSHIFANEFGMILENAFPYLAVKKMDTDTDPKREIDWCDAVVVYWIYVGQTLLCTFRITFVELKEEERWSSLIGYYIRYINTSLLDMAKSFVGGVKYDR